MNVITRGIRNAFRNTIRTVSVVIILGLSIALALAMLIARQAVSEKITSVKSSVGNTVSISPAGVRGFEGGGDALTESQLASVKKLTHVASVTESLSDRLTTDNTTLKSAVDAGSLGKRFSENSGQKVEGPTFVMQDKSSDGTVTTSFTPPVTVLGTTNPTASLSSSEGGGTFTLKSGKTFASDSSDNVAIIGSSLATKNSLKVGSTFTAYGKTITVIGIFDAGNTFSNNQVLMPLKTVQTLSDQAGAITSATVNVDSISNVEGVTSAVKSKLGSKADVTNASAQAEETIKPLENIQTISLYSLIGSVIAGSVIILLTMIMIVRERRREIGVAKAIGASNMTIMLQFMTEAITLTILGAVIGIALGVAAGNPITKMLVNNSTSSSSTGMENGMRMGEAGGRAMRGALGGFRSSVSNVTAHVGWDIILYGLGAAIIIAVIGSAIASYFIAKVRPAEVMRAE
jgi:putative ABC transport system permease protein